MKILALEDSRFALKLLERGLQDLATVVPAPSITSARKELNNAFDLIITDLMLPDGTGQEFIVETRQHPIHHSTPILVVSSTLSQVEQQEISVLGCNDWMKKPIRPKILQEVVKNLVQSPYSRIPESKFLPVQVFVWREGGEYSCFIPALKESFSSKMCELEEFKLWLKEQLIARDLPWDISVPRFPELSTLLLPSNQGELKLDKALRE